MTSEQHRPAGDDQGEGANPPPAGRVRASASVPVPNRSQPPPVDEQDRQGPPSGSPPVESGAWDQASGVWAGQPSGEQPSWPGQSGEQGSWAGQPSGEQRPAGPPPGWAGEQRPSG